MMKRRQDRLRIGMKESRNLAKRGGGGKVDVEGVDERRKGRLAM